MRRSSLQRDFQDRRRRRQRRRRFQHRPAPPPLPAPTRPPPPLTDGVVNIGGQRPWPSFDAAETRQRLSRSLGIHTGIGTDETKAAPPLEPSGAAGSSGLPMQARVSAWASDAGGGGGNRLAPAGDQRGPWVVEPVTGLPNWMVAELSWSRARETLRSHERSWRRAENWWGSRRDDDWWNSGEWWESQRADDWWNSDGTTSDQRGRG